MRIGFCLLSVYRSGDVMKRTIRTLSLLVLSLFLTCCNNSGDNGMDVAYKFGNQLDAVQYIAYSLDEIYANGDFEENLITPAYKRTRIFPTGDIAYSFFTHWSRVYVSPDNHTLSFAQLCQDSLCTHTSLPCISYAALVSSEVVEANGILYLLLEGDGEKSNKFIEYDLSSGKYSILGEFENGGQLITRLGRFIYFFIIRVDGQTDSGRVLTKRLIYRYDISEKKLDKIDELSPTEIFFMPSSRGGYIYYINSLNTLYRCDANMQNKDELAGNVTTYEVVDEDIYYLFKLPGAEYGTIFVLHTDDASTEELYSNVTWFCINDNTMYYSLYSPIGAFEWDIPAQDESGNRVLKSTEISVEHGNTIYSIGLDNVGSKGKVLKVCSSLTDNEQYMGPAFSVLNGYLYTQLKESYHSNSKKGLHTGIAAISLENGEVYWIDTEYVMY